MNSKRFRFVWVMPSTASRSPVCLSSSIALRNASRFMKSGPAGRNQRWASRLSTYCRKRRARTLHVSKNSPESRSILFQRARTASKRLSRRIRSNRSSASNQSDRAPPPPPPDDELLDCTVTETVAESLSPPGSDTARLKRSKVSDETVGAENDALDVLAPLSVTVGPSVCVQV